MGRIVGRAKDERGASLVEYALLVALVAVVCIGAVTFLGSSASGKLDGAGNGIAVQGQACFEELTSEGWKHVFYTPNDQNSVGPVQDGRCP